MKLRVIYDSCLVSSSYDAWVLFPFMFFRAAKENVSDQLFRHELEHVYQVMRVGWLCFYSKYLWYLYLHGYNEHPFELEAKARQYDPLTKDEITLKEAGDGR